MSEQAKYRTESVLGEAADLTPESVVHAYRELAIVLHPDKALVTNLAFMQRLNEAKDYFLKQHWAKRTATRTE